MRTIIPSAAICLVAALCAMTLGVAFAVSSSSVWHTNGGGITHGCPDTPGCTDGDPKGDQKRKGKNYRAGYYVGSVYVKGMSSASVGVYRLGSTTPAGNGVVACSGACNSNSVCVGCTSPSPIDLECNYRTIHNAVPSGGGAAISNHEMYTVSYYQGEC